MNIAILCFGISTIANPAGTEKVFVEMSNAFAVRGANVYAVWNDEPGVAPYFPFEGRVHQVNLALGKIKVPGKYKIIREIAKGLHLDISNRVDAYKTNQLGKALNEKIDVSLLDIIICYEFNSIMVANRLADGKIPVVAMCHNSVEDQIASLTPLQRREADKVSIYQVLLPSFVLEARKYLSTKICTIPNAVPQISDSQVADLSSPKDSYTIVMLGRIEGYQKRPFITVKAFLMLAHEFPKWQLHLYGPVTDEEYMEKIQEYCREHDHGHQVKYMGVTKEAVSVLRNADILAFPSAFEGFSLSLTEANAAGLPAIGFAEAPAVNELIQDGVTGYLAANEKDFTHKLQLLMSDQQERVRMGQNAHKAMKAYAPDIVWGKWEQLLTDLTHKRFTE